MARTPADTAVQIVAAERHYTSVPFHQVHVAWWALSRQAVDNGVESCHQQMCRALAQAVREGRLMQTGYGDGAVYSLAADAQPRVPVMVATREDLQHEQATGQPATWHTQRSLSAEEQQAQTLATMDDETIEIADLIIDQTVDRGMPTLLPEGRGMPSTAWLQLMCALLTCGLTEEQARALLQRRLGHDLQVCGRSREAVCRRYDAHLTSTHGTSCLPV